MSDALDRAEDEAREPLEIALSDEVRRALSFQTYGGAATIQDVRSVRLKKHQAENGWFMELFRATAGSVDSPVAGGAFDLRQVSVARAAPHRINAFHIHPKVRQDEIWTVLEGSLLVWLADCRKGSPSEGVCQRVILAADEPTLLFIPSGVAHGYRASSEGALLLYAMNQQFDAGDPNEGRLPWDHFGAELWEADRG